MANFVFVDNTVLGNLWNASNGNLDVATRLFNGLLRPNTTLVITDTVKGEATVSVNQANPYPKDAFIDGWITANSARISQPVTGLSPGNDNGERSIALARRAD
ncbi:hypothetical protein JQ628_15510 [Bradyrhizobium lablabi]|uniref:hypothetical protein n=1 Tax=Bradyrhizobium lablabi TaxID=722472 RepID=UPI001BAB0C85|nr:hypothetical protein [Bradyrhizobium lablabi]MBR1122934.1 hypothetical protein [Bradyrhizobium lablabi]